MGDPNPCLSPHTSLLPQPFPTLRPLARNVLGLQEVRGQENPPQQEEWQGDHRGFLFLGSVGQVLGQGRAGSRVVAADGGNGGWWP